MPILDLYSYRKRVSEGDVPDVYKYDHLPRELRTQLVHILDDSIGLLDADGDPIDSYYRDRDWVVIHNALAREYGQFELAAGNFARERCVNFILNERLPIEAILDLIEVSFNHLKNRNLSVHQRRPRGVFSTPKQAIEELNERFRRAGIGYQFECGIIIRVDSELTHSQIVKPALRYLDESGFEGPRDEFLQAHKHYRSGETKDAITDANNAFESTLKVICDKRDWAYDKKATVSTLLKVVKTNGLFPDYLDNSFTQLVSTLKSGLPSIRDEEGAHGQGKVARDTPDYVAAYALHLSAANIQFLVKANKDL